MTVVHGWMARLRARRARYRFFHRRPKAVVLGLWWRTRRTFSGRDRLGALLMLEDKLGVVYQCELTPTRLWAMLDLKREGLVKLDLGYSELTHFHLCCNGGNLRTMIREEADLLNIDPTHYLRPELAWFFDRHMAPQ